LDRHYKIEHAFNHVAKLRKDQPTDLGDVALKKNK